MITQLLCKILPIQVARPSFIWKFTMVFPKRRDDAKICCYGTQQSCWALSGFTIVNIHWHDEGRKETPVKCTLKTATVRRQVLTFSRRVLLLFLLPAVAPPPQKKKNPVHTYRRSAKDDQYSIVVRSTSGGRMDFFSCVLSQIQTVLCGFRCSRVIFLESYYGKPRWFSTDASNTIFSREFWRSGFITMRQSL